ncbi:hypothetical protein Dsin_030657 [Dipteronia sinensis]|uniref:DUF4283 domain-containing protein n=1 Tax=Dipteronia sinensis TaxID=43782 RepID=A0AAD9ZJY1_9ROSI|nr:hypothetical protein Dsin_030657 [Dipteronia sinensis]
MTWESGLNKEAWLSKCAIGVLKHFSNVSYVVDRLQGKGCSFSSSYLGDKSILWEFYSASDRDMFIIKQALWNDCFSMMGRWSRDLLPQARTVWVTCYGIPLECLSKAFFLKVWLIIGEPLLIEEETSHRKRLDMGRMLVLIPIGHSCPDSIKVFHGRSSFFVLMTEDPSPVEYPWLKKRLGLVESIPLRKSSASHVSIGQEVPKSIINPCLAECKKGRVILDVTLKPSVDKGKKLYLKKTRVKSSALCTPNAIVEIGKRRLSFQKTE